MDSSHPLPSTSSTRIPREGIVIIIVIGVSLIGIIGFVFPTGHPYSVGDQANAQNTIIQLQRSIATYYTEYRRYPVKQGKAKDSDFLSNHELMGLLISTDQPAISPQRISFFAGKEARPMGEGKYRDGLKMDNDGRWELWDPWGNYYHVRMDLDYNDEVADPYSDKSQAENMIPQSVIVWSVGEDGIEGTSDDIATWK